MFRFLKSLFVKPEKRRNGVSVREFYNGCAEKEFLRTHRDASHLLEFETTEHFYKKYLKPGMKILDAGGGPGRYTVDLAKQGYHMTLLDISDKELELARKKIKELRVGKNVDSVDLGSITELPYKDNSFDMVLCVGGPVSHLRSVADRKKAIKELVRVAKPGAPIFISVMALPAVLNLCVKDFKKYISEYGYKNEEEFWRETKILVEKGDDNWWCACSYAHFFWPSELKDLVLKTAKNTKLLHMVALEWPCQNLHDEFNEISKNKRHYKKWLDLHYSICEHPDMLSLSAHIMIAIQKKK
ncbi:MAG: class I SAM-dependent methyltransferase [Alphaproteobacteria bacterium]|nr:class I SAM-dependent methyltransferase [Alphaproteobacteria bacterium]